MKINEIKERIKSINYEDSNYSSFLLADYQNGSTNEVLPIENKTTNLEYDNKRLVLTDREGNILIPISTACNYEIAYVDGNTIVIKTNVKVPGSANQRKVLIGIAHYTYDEKTKTLVKEKNLKEEGEFLLGAITPCEDSDVIIVNKEQGGKRSSQLYSVGKKEYISPKFCSIERTENPKVFMFTDTIKSNELLDDQKLTSTVIGFINIDGRMHDEIYDGNINSIRSLPLERDDEFKHYILFKLGLSHELDREISKKKEDKKVQRRIIQLIKERATKKTEC